MDQAPNTSKRKRRKIKKAGLPPGSLVYTGSRESAVKITVFDYNAETFLEKEIADIEECSPFRDRDSTSWINLDGINDLNQIRRIGEIFDIHSLVLEDIVHTYQRPKLDEHENYLFVVLRMLEINGEQNSGEQHTREQPTRGQSAVNSEQISFILTKNCVISFQEIPGDIFDPIRERIRSGSGRLRKLGADYLLYTLIDAIVDHYFVIIEKIGEKVEQIEDRITASPAPMNAHEIYKLKQEMIMIRKAVWPQREVVSRLERLETPLISKNTTIYLRDVYDHAVQVIDAIESYRDILSGLLEIYLASVSNRMNEVMKVLTVISTIFIPLTFIAGVYGMNFHHMPELRWQNGYYLVLALMAAIAGFMLLFFRRKKWI